MVLVLFVALSDSESLSVRSEINRPCRRKKKMAVTQTGRYNGKRCREKATKDGKRKDSVGRFNHVSR